MTAIDWLFNELWEAPKDKFTWHTILKKAKEMDEQSKEIPSIVTDGSISINLNEHIITYNYETVKLPKKVVQLTAYFILNKGKLLTRDNILKNVWGEGVCIGERTIDVHVAKIKKFFYSDCIETVSGVGYRWSN